MYVKYVDTDKPNMTISRLNISNYFSLYLMKDILVEQPTRMVFSHDYLSSGRWSWNSWDVSIKWRMQQKNQLKRLHNDTKQWQGSKTI